MAPHLKLVFHGYVEVKKQTSLYVVKYVRGNRDPHVLSFSRWYQEAPTFYWGVCESEAQIAGCSQLAWTILFAYLIKQTGLTDSRKTADLLTESLVSRFVKQKISRMPEIWWLSGKTIAKFLSNSQFPIPSP